MKRISLKDQACAQTLMDFARVVENSSVEAKADIIDMAKQEARRMNPGARPSVSDQQRIDTMVERLEANMRMSMLDTPAGRLATRPLGEYARARSKPSQETIK